MSSQAVCRPKLYDPQSRNILAVLFGTSPNMKTDGFIDRGAEDEAGKGGGGGGGGGGGVGEEVNAHIHHARTQQAIEVSGKCTSEGAR